MEKYYYAGNSHNGFSDDGSRRLFDLPYHSVEDLDQHFWVADVINWKVFKTLTTGPEPLKARITHNPNMLFVWDKHRDVLIAGDKHSTMKYVFVKVEND
jgi:hypothetical protein